MKQMVLLLGSWKQYYVLGKIKPQIEIENVLRNKTFWPQLNKNRVDGSIEDWNVEPEENLYFLLNHENFKLYLNRSKVYYLIKLV